MAYFNFSNLIRKYSTSFVAILPSGGDYNDSGDWITSNPTQITMTGAIISMRESRILRSGGVYTKQDRALYTLEPLDKALQGARIIHKGKEYRLESELTNSDFTGVWAYVLKYVSVFGGGDVDG